MIQRYFSDENFKRIQKDFAFLLNMIQTSYGEYDLSIRDDYFNIYYKGNSLAKVTFKKNDCYQVSIHSKFFENTSADNQKYYKDFKKSNDYYIIDLSAKQLHPFFQKKHLTQIASKIKSVNNGEEIGFEQALITDNLNSEKVIFIDRQVTDTIMPGKLDLLALKQVEGNKYHFLISEVKLGNNAELKEDVASQLNKYINHLKQNFIDYKACYEKHYYQKKKLGLFEKPSFAQIEIEEPVEGIIIVGGYSGIAKTQIESLVKKYPNLYVRHFKYELYNS